MWKGYIKFIAPISAKCMAHIISVAIHDRLPAVFDMKIRNFRLESWRSSTQLYKVCAETAFGGFRSLAPPVSTTLLCRRPSEKQYHFLNIFRMTWYCSSIVNWVHAFRLILQTFPFAVDWFKHAFVLKFNHIPIESYMEYRTTLAYDLVNGRQKGSISDHYDVISRRMGFIPLPLSILVIFACISQNACLHTIQSCIFSSFISHGSLWIFMVWEASLQFCWASWCEFNYRSFDATRLPSVALIL